MCPMTQTIHLTHSKGYTTPHNKEWKLTCAPLALNKTPLLPLCLMSHHFSRVLLALKRSH